MSACTVTAAPEPVAAATNPDEAPRLRVTAEDEPSRRPRESLVWCAAAGLVGLLFLFTNLGGWRVFNRHEALAVVPAAEMLETGDFVVPTYGGVPRLKKPPLVYWTLAMTGAVCGGLDAWTARLPMAVAALALAIVVARWAGAWYGRPAAVGAFLAQTGSVWVVTYGRTAEVDILLCLLTTSAMSFAAVDRGRPVRWWAIGTLLGVASLGKFAFAPGLTLAAVVLFLLLEGRGADLRRAATTPGGLLGIAALTAGLLAWPLAVATLRPEAAGIWATETVGRAVGTLGTQPWWYYLPPLIWLTLPWSPFAIPAAARSWGEAFGRRRDPGQAGSRERFLWVWLLTQVVLLSLSANKHKHYLLPVLPVVSLWAGRRVAEFAERVEAGRPVHEWPLATGGAAAAVAAVAVGLLGFRERIDPSVFGPMAAAAAVMATLGAAAFLLLPLRKPRSAAAIGLALLVVPYVFAMTTILPAGDARRELAAFAAEVDRVVPPGKTLAAAGIGEHEIVGLLTHRIRRDVPAGATDFALVPSEAVPSEAAAGEVWVADEASGLALVGPRSD